jgi:transcriptional regulator with XRE-family HTH domain
MKTLKTFLREQFSTEERAEIRRRAREKVAGIRLQHLRELRHLTQAEAADAMGVSQAALSKLERRPNVTISALQRYVEALGCRLEVTVVMPSNRDRSRMKIAGLRGNSPRGRARSVRRIPLLTP